MTKRTKTKRQLSTTNAYYPFSVSTRESDSIKQTTDLGVKMYYFSFQVIQPILLGPYS